jgi:hypothetical protein
MNRIKYISFFWALALTTLSSCTKEPARVSLNFEHQIDGENLELYVMDYENEFGNTYNVQLLRYIVSKIQLIDDKGNSYELEDFHYVDIETSSTLSLGESLKIPVGDYHSIQFTFGLDEEMNISNSLLTEPLHGAMAWPDQMGGGYHYMRIEGAYIASDETQHFYLTHTGSTAGVARHINYSLPINLNASEEQEYQIDLTMNLNQWYSNPNTYNFEDYDDGIMGDSEAQQLIHDNGHNVFSVGIK